MTAAFDPLLTVDLIGDHANVLSLEFPADLPAEEPYAYRVSAVVENYLSSPEITDYLCNSGFAEVRLAVKGMNDGLVHAMWKADVTSEGLVEMRTVEFRQVESRNENDESEEAASQYQLSTPSRPTDQR